GTSSNVNGASAGSGSTISQVLTSADGVTNGTQQYIITPAAAGCPGPSLSITVTVRPVPVITNTATSMQTTICSGTTLSFLPTSSVTGTLYTWTSVVSGPVTGVSPSGNGTIADVPVNTGNVAGTITYTITPTANTCVGNTRDFVVTVQPVPSANGTNITICSGQTASVILDPSPKNVSGTTFGWTITASSNVTGAFNDNGSLIQQSLSLTNYTVGTVVYHVTPTANNCTGPVKDITVTVNPVAIVDAGIDYTLCQPTTIPLSGTIGGAASSGTWSIVSGAGTLSASTTTGTGVTATYTVDPSDITTTVTFMLTTNDPDNAGPCSLVTDLLNIQLNLAPTVVAMNDQTLCEPNQFPVSGTLGGSATTALWSIVQGNGTLFSTNIVTGSPITANATYNVDPADITYPVSQAITLRLTTNDPDGPTGPCVAVADDVVVTINEAAKVVAPASLEMCEKQTGAPISTSIALGAVQSGAITTATWTTTGAGTFSNINDPNARYFYSHPSEVNQIIPLVITVSDPDGLGPCTSNSDTVRVKVNPLPIVDFVTLPFQIAENNLPITLNGNQSGGLFTIQPASSNIGSTTQTPLDKVVFDPSAATLGTNFITYTYTIPATGCVNNVVKQIQVNPVTNVDFIVANSQTNRKDSNGEFAFDVCPNQGYVVLSPNTVPKLGESADFTAVTITGQTPLDIRFDGTNYSFNTDGVPPGSYIIQYNFTNIYNATTFKPRTINILGAPVAKFGVLNRCIDTKIQYQDSSFVQPSPFPDSVVNWTWDFGPSQGIDFSRNPLHPYPAAAVYQTALKVTTALNCSNTILKPVQLGAPPVVDFDWSAICNNDSTRFESLSVTKNNIGYITKYTWDFGDGKPVVASATPADSTANITAIAGTRGTYKKPLHKFSNFQSYPVTLTINTSDGCSDFVQKTVFILPYQTLNISPQDAYKEDFELNDGAWQPEALRTGSDSSWMYGIPNGPQNLANSLLSGIYTGTKSWWTGKRSGAATTYAKNESSVINGPCLNISALRRPMIALDYWSDSDPNIDGAVVQYSTNGGVDWYVVGPPLAQPDRQEGIYWYNGNPVTANPGEQLVTAYGWTGKTDGWKRARFRLDMIPVNERKQVRLRVGFASNNDNPPNVHYDGFAFDNVFVGEKQRNVVIEHFTNVDPTISNTDVVIDNLFSNTMNQHLDTLGNSYSDFQDLRYHVSYPPGDPFYQENPKDANSRMLFYGRTQPPYTIMDGILGNFDRVIGDWDRDSIPPFQGRYTDIVNKWIDKRALTDPEFDIQLDTIATGLGTTISLDMTVTTLIPVQNQIVMQVALIETDVNGSRNVVRKLLLGPAGHVPNLSWTTAGFSYQHQFLDLPISVTINDPSKLKLVAFIQDKVTKVIYQSLVIQAPAKRGGPITGIEGHSGPLAAMKMYPNPSNGYVNLVLPEVGSHAGHNWSLVNQQGVEVSSGSFEGAANGVVQVNVSDLPNAVYIVIVNGPDGQTERRKLVVMNRN
ncbi:MAG: T9SS type A sorting domain-containing protein, partial [Cyclobacteriaceae bacterium]|nr:T9SS type A sorting domain-containing protein [Cyclobacteriaceae bacterium]